MALDGTEKGLLVGAGILTALLVFIRIRWRGGPDAFRLFSSGDTRSPEELDAFFMKQAAEEQVAREELWARAHTDLKAAKDLRRRLLQDIETDALARKEFGPDPDSTPDLMKQIDDSERDARSELAKVDALIQQLRLR
jgi:hypothetical protein